MTRRTSIRTILETKSRSPGVIAMRCRWIVTALSNPSHATRPRRLRVGNESSAATAEDNVARRPHDPRRLRPFWRSTTIVTSMMMVVTLAAGCVVNEPESPARGVIVSGPPPAPVQEERPPAPTPQAIWVAGYWHWTGLRYAWIPGHWESPPMGAVWNAPRVTTMQDGRYVYESGGWKNADGSQRNAIR